MKIKLISTSNSISSNLEKRAFWEMKMSLASRHYVIGNFHGQSKNPRQKFCRKQLKNG